VNLPSRSSTSRHFCFLQRGPLQAFLVSSPRKVNVPAPPPTSSTSHGGAFPRISRIFLFSTSLFLLYPSRVTLPFCRPFRAFSPLFSPSRQTIHRSPCFFFAELPLNSVFSCDSPRTFSPPGMCSTFSLFLPRARKRLLWVFHFLPRSFFSPIIYPSVLRLPPSVIPSFQSRRRLI